MVAKFALPVAGHEIVRTSLRVPDMMLKSMDEAMHSSPFNKKQRSKWIAGITEELLLRSDASNLIAEEFISPGRTESIPITIPIGLDNKINMVIRLVQETEGRSSDRSSVIRTAITQHLMALKGIQLSPKETLQEKIRALGGYDEQSK